MTKESHFDKEFIPAINKIHPFLEVGGALRTQVPLPRTTEDLYSLTQIVLGNQTRNVAENTDQYFFTPQGFLDPNFPGLSFEVEKATIKSDKGGTSTRRRGMMVWDDPAGVTGGNNIAPCQNLYVLMCSIIFQQTDLDVYNKRGRYGAKVVKRLVDGHANKPAADEIPSRIVSVFTFNHETGHPYGFFTGTVYNSIKAPHGQMRQIPTVLLQYMFVKGQDLHTLKDATGAYISGENGTRVKTTTLIEALLLAYSEKMVTHTPASDHLITIHTDKFLVIKSINKQIEAPEERLKEYQLVASKVFADTAADPDGLHEDFTVEPFPIVYQIDQSTVPKGDAGEEVPNPSVDFYKGAYQTYRALVRQKTGITIPEKLENGRISMAAFDDTISRYGLNKVAFSAWLHDSCAIENKVGAEKTGPILHADGRVYDIYPLNNQKAWKSLSPLVASKHLGITDKATLKAFRQEVSAILTDHAKAGNTGNQDYSNGMTTVPRLTEFGFIVVGSVKKSSNLAKCLPMAKYYLESAIRKKHSRLRSRL
ncbi:hypothetical protein [Sneathiella chinensis]|uniref:Uncharacterized protein n=1 Tax=Sneathiella chinensis TaxID=349750 RepID=A0ABQ5U230_9PROT|nr:hypothetical protein [Sneathiella chinensis]GLQ05888.1 hypothetical protein GCM10007924_11090 [Sneathiella chinensis]